jgi:quercetin dioxygenase-like cupin family protein
MTIILFAFEANGILKEHRAEGAMTIQVLAGRLQIVVDEEAREVGPGELMAMAPGVPHSIRALEASDMLLTIHHLPLDEAAT